MRPFPRSIAISTIQTCVALLLALALVASTAGATTIDFSGSVSGIFGPMSTTTFQEQGVLPELGFVEGAALSGRLVWDETAADTNPDPGEGLYAGAVKLLQIEIGPNSWQIVDGEVRIIRDTFDPIQISGMATGSMFGSFGPGLFMMDFDDPNGWIQDDGLPSGAAPFSSFIAPGSFSLNFFDGDDLTFEIEANFEYTVVPEPSSALLIGFGLAVLADRRRRASILD